jgi:hypothetical protein
LVYIILIGRCKSNYNRSVAMATLILHYTVQGKNISTINKIDHHDITEILLEVASNTINPPPKNLLIFNKFAIILPLS